MKKLFIENIFFEDEIINPNKNFQELFFTHPHLLQLQFLPLLYADPEDTVLITDLPPKEFLQALDNPPRILLLDDLLKLASPGKWGLNLWGGSAIISSLFGESYSYPPFEILKKIHTKLFCFNHTPKLPLSSLLTTEKQAFEFIYSNTQEKVLKTLYGRSGSGHFIISPNIFSEKKLKSFLNKEFSQKRPVIGQLWLNRLLDFSTQWEIEKNAIKFIGLTIIENTTKGTYIKTHVNKSSPLLDRFYTQHLEEAKKLLTEVQRNGFFGPLGIDAMIYEKEGTAFHHLLEINARKTMSLVALKIMKKKNLKTLTLSFEKTDKGLLPTYLNTSKKKYIFGKNLVINSLV